RTGDLHHAVVDSRESALADDARTSATRGGHRGRDRAAHRSPARRRSAIPLSQVAVAGAHPYTADRGRADIVARLSAADAGRPEPNGGTGIFLQCNLFHL